MAEEKVHVIALSPLMSARCKTLRNDAVKSRNGTKKTLTTNLRVKRPSKPK